jgi:tRNA nucleotidyltransferase (CCA-adding enzyme)
MPSAHAAHWEHFPHGADVGVRGVAPTRAGAFEQAALALTAVITNPAAVRPTVSVPIVCEEPTDDLLLIEWLNTLVYEMATRRMLFGAFDVTIDGPRLTGIARGEPVDRARHEPAVEVKGATWTALRVGERPDGLWTAECVVDV